jgi:hypothetical protein
MSFLTLYALASDSLFTRTYLCKKKWIWLGEYEDLLVDYYDDGDDDAMLSNLLWYPVYWVPSEFAELRETMLNLYSVVDYPEDYPVSMYTTDNEQFSRLIAHVCAVHTRRSKEADRLAAAHAARLVAARDESHAVRRTSASGARRRTFTTVDSACC